MPKLPTAVRPVPPIFLFPLSITTEEYPGISPSRTNIIAVSYDTTYDNAALSLNAVSCSDGTNGLETKYKFSTLGDIPVFPLVGGAQAIAGWNDANVSFFFFLFFTLCLLSFFFWAQHPRLKKNNVPR